MRLEPGQLTWEAATELAPQVRPSDLIECPDRDAFRALAMGMSLGPAWTARREPSGEVLGAYGWTRSMGTIWALFKELTWAESIAVLHHTPLWVRQMVRESQRPFLWNYVHAEHREAIGWLEASKCFAIDYTRRKGDPMEPAYYFCTKPLERLP